MSEAQHLPTPLYRNQFSLEIFPFGTPTIMEKTLLKLFDDLKFAHWEIVEEHHNHIALTLGIEETEENIERIHNFIAAGRAREAINTLTIHREDRKMNSKGFVMFTNLKFRSARASLDAKAHEPSYTKIVLHASDFNFGWKKKAEEA